MRAQAGGIPDSAIPTFEMLKPKFGREGAGGHSNEANFKEAIREVSITAAQIKLPAELQELIESEAKALPERVPEKGAKGRLQSIIWDCADWSVNEFGVQPAVSCPNFFSAVGKLVVGKLPGKWKEFNIAAMLQTRVGEYKRGGHKGGVVRVGLDEVELNTPLKVLLSAGKIELVSRDNRARKRKRKGAFDLRPPPHFPNGPPEFDDDQLVGDDDLFGEGDDDLFGEGGNENVQPQPCAATNASDTAASTAAGNANPRAATDASDTGAGAGVGAGTGASAASTVGGGSRIDEASLLDGSADESDEEHGTTKPRRQPSAKRSAKPPAKRSAKPPAKKPAPTKSAAKKPAARKPTVSDANAALELLPAQLEDKPALTDLQVGMDLAVLRTAYPRAKVRNADSVGWRAEITKIDLDKETLFLYGFWFPYDSEFLSGVEQLEDDSDDDDSSGDSDSSHSGSDGSDSESDDA